MEFLLISLLKVIIPVTLAANNDATTGSFISDKIGFIVLGIIVGPVFLLTLFSMIESRNSRIPALFIGAFVTLVGALVAGFAVIGIALKFVIPQ